MHARRIAVAAALTLSVALPARAGADSIHTVAAGESLSSVAAADGLSVSALAAANGISPAAGLTVGQPLAIPPQGVATPAAVAVVPVAAESPSTASGPATGPANQQITGDTSNGPYPTAESVSSTQVGSEASVDGVSPAFADAVANQESGFSNDLVSSTGAVGVMQIEPATWSWITTALAKPGAPLSPSSAYSNVAGGVRLLHDLVAQTGSEEMAAAAYYQGLASVRQNGLYPSTQAYVASVMAQTSRYGG